MLTLFMIIVLHNKQLKQSGFQKIDFEPSMWCIQAISLTNGRTAKPSS